MTSAEIMAPPPFCSAELNTLGRRSPLLLGPFLNQHLENAIVVVALDGLRVRVLREGEAALEGPEDPLVAVVDLVLLLLLLFHLAADLQLVVANELDRQVILLGSRNLNADLVLLLSLADVSPWLPGGDAAEAWVDGATLEETQGGGIEEEGVKEVRWAAPE